MSKQITIEELQTYLWGAAVLLRTNIALVLCNQNPLLNERGK